MATDFMLLFSFYSSQKTKHTVTNMPQFAALSIEVLSLITIQALSVPVCRRRQCLQGKFFHILGQSRRRSASKLLGARVKTTLDDAIAAKKNDELIDAQNFKARERKLIANVKKLLACFSRNSRRCFTSERYAK